MTPSSVERKPSINHYIYEKNLGTDQQHHALTSHKNQISMVKPGCVNVTLRSNFSQMARVIGRKINLNFACC